MRSSMATNHIGSEMGVPSSIRVVRMPVWAAVNISHASSLLSRGLIGLRPLIVRLRRRSFPSVRRRASLAAARSWHVGALRFREALADVLSGGRLAGIVVEPGVEAAGALAVGHGARDGREGVT